MTLSHSTQNIEMQLKSYCHMDMKFIRGTKDITIARQ